MKTKLPYFKDGKVITPPEGYFILPEDVNLLPIGDNGDKYYNINLQKWSENVNANELDIKENCSSNIPCYARPIRGNEELYNQMAFLPEQIITPPKGVLFASR